MNSADCVQRLTGRENARQGTGRTTPGISLDPVTAEWFGSWFRSLICAAEWRGRFVELQRRGLPVGVVVRFSHSSRGVDSAHKKSRGLTPADVTSTGLRDPASVFNGSKEAEPRSIPISVLHHQSYTTLREQCSSNEGLRCRRGLSLGQSSRL